MHPRLASIVFVCASLLAAPALAQERCDCAATTCAPMTDGGAAVRGRVVESEGRDANGRVERFFALVPSRPVCAEIAGQENPSRRTSTRADRVQLVLTDLALRARVQATVGRELTLRGTLFASITAHHHTPLLLDARSVVEESAAGDTEGDESRVAIDGQWRVTGYLRSSISALSDTPAQRVIGRAMHFLAPLATPWGGCARPTLRHQPVAVESFLNDARIEALPPARATSLGLRNGTLEMWTATCGDAGAPTTFYETSAGAVLIGHDGVWYVLARGRR